MGRALRTGTLRKGWEARVVVANGRAIWRSGRQLCIYSIEAGAKGYGQDSDPITWHDNS